MRTSSRGNDDQSNKIPISGSPSKSLTCLVSSSPSSPLSPSTTKSMTMTMDDVWKDLNLIPTTTSNEFSGAILQNFLCPLPYSYSTGGGGVGLKVKYGSNLQSKSKNVENPCLRSVVNMPLNVCKKRPPENEDIAGDEHLKRMIKNRESAARSRDRKHAYTNELEVELERLKRENAKLRKQIETLCFTAPAPLPKKQTLCRTLTAPF